MANLKSIILLSLCTLLLSVGTSCSTKKKSVENEIYEEFNNTKGTEILGFAITTHDNVDLYKEANRWINTPYSYGGTSKGGVDCSGLVMNIYLKIYDKKIHRSSATIMKENCIKISKNKLKEGDLVFFSTSKNSNKITHVGLYLKNGKFLHASTSRGVIVSDLSEKYYVKNFVCAGRVK